MKTKEQVWAEAKLRQLEIAQKNKKIVAKSGNVKTSFARCAPEYLENMGFYKRDSDRKPSKDAWVKKKLNKQLIEIDVRKK